MTTTQLPRCREALLGLAIAIGLACAGAPGAVAAEEPPAEAVPTLEYATTFKAANGQQIKRVHQSPLRVLTFLDVDDDDPAELLATVVPLGNWYQLNIQRLDSGTLPVSVEAIIPDPSSGGTLPRDKIFFGYDARASTAPSSWVSTITIGQSPGTTTVDVTTDVDAPGASILTTAGMFDGDPLARTGVLGGTVRYAPVPPQAKLGLTIGPSVEVRAGATGSAVPIDATADVTLSEPGVTKAIHAHVNSLPSMLRLRHTLADGVRTVSYRGDATVPAADGYYTETAKGQLTRKVTVKATGVPTVFDVISNPADRTAVTTSGGALRSIEFASANGEPLKLQADHPYVRVKKTTNFLTGAVVDSLAVRADDLQSAVIDTPASQLTAAELRLAPGTRSPLRVLHERDSGTVDGTISNLPRHVRVTYAPATGEATYAGFGETIDSADVVFNSRLALFGKVKRIEGHLSGLPTSLTARFQKSSTGSGFDFTASPAVRMIEAAFTDGRTNYPGLGGGQAGAFIRDLPSEYTGFARLYNVRRGEFAKVDGRLHARVQTDPLDATGRLQDFKVYATIDTPNDAVQPPAQIDVHIDALPTDVAIDQSAEWTKVVGNRPIPNATLWASNLPGASLTGAIHNVSAKLTGVPASFTVGYGPANRSITAHDGAKFDRIELTAWDTGEMPDPLPNDDPTESATVKLDDRDGRLSLRARAVDISAAGFEGFLGVSRAFAKFGRPQPWSNVVEFTQRGGTTADPSDLEVRVGADLPGGAFPTDMSVKFVQRNGVHMIWDGNDRAEIRTVLSSKQVSTDPDAGLAVKLPTHAELCVGGPIACDPQSRNEFGIWWDGSPRIITNAATIVSDAPAPITINGRICLPPTDDDGHPTGDGVYGNCPGSSQVIVDHVTMKRARLEFGMEGKVLKLYLDTDQTGIGGNAIKATNSATDKLVRVGLDSARPLRNHWEFQPFLGVSAIGGLIDDADSIHQESQMDCAGLSIVAAWHGWYVDAKDAIIPNGWCAD